MSKIRKVISGLNKFLKLDQTTPQIVVNGVPDFYSGINVGGASLTEGSIPSISVFGFATGDTLRVMNQGFSGVTPGMYLFEKALKYSFDNTMLFNLPEDVNAFILEDSSIGGEIMHVDTHNLLVCFDCDSLGYKFGIGKSNPDNLLDILATSANDGIEIKNSAESGYIKIQAYAIDPDTSFYPMISAKPTGDYGFKFRGIKSATGSSSTPVFVLQASNSSNNGAIADDDVAIALQNWGTNIMTLLGKGYVGIGTTPTEVLDVVGNVKASGTYKIKGTSTGITSIATANTSATSYTQTLQARTGTIANLDNTFYIGTTQIALNRGSGALTLAGITLTTPNIGAATGTSLSTTGIINSGVTTIGLRSGDTSFAISSNTIDLGGDVAGNTISTITGGTAGMTLTIVFKDNKVTMTDTGAGGASNTMNLNGTFNSQAEATLTLVLTGSTWKEVCRSLN